MVTAFRRWATGLKSWQLLLVTVVLFLLDLLVPDPLPMVDEVLLGLLALWLSKRKARAPR